MNPDFARLARYLTVSISKQTMDFYRHGQIYRRYHVSTAKNGPGEQQGSECTPTGWHTIRAKIGQGKPIHSVFVGRRLTGEIYDTHLQQQHPDRDWVLSRILWLGGKEPGFNRYGKVDSTWRYIYIHGSPEHLVAGFPDSHGCIRMTNQDVVELFEEVEVGDNVLIQP